MKTKITTMSVEELKKKRAEAIRKTNDLRELIKAQKMQVKSIDLMIKIKEREND